MTNVIWIGGPAASGKSLVSRMVARRNGIRWYSMDAHSWIHEDRAVRAGLHVRGRGPGNFDRVPMVLDDLRVVQPQVLTIVEGALLTPEKVPKLGDALWLMPSPDEQLARLEHRHPEGVDEGYVMGWTLISESLLGTNARVLRVDGQSPEETIAAVEDLFWKQISGGPRVVGVGERRDLIRYSNRVLATHAVTGCQRMPSSMDPTTLVRTFDCECGEASCQATLDLTVEDAVARLRVAPPSVVEAGH